MSDILSTLMQNLKEVYGFRVRYGTISSTIRRLVGGTYQSRYGKAHRRLLGTKWLWELHCQKVGGIIGDEMVSTAEANIALLYITQC